MTMRRRHMIAGLGAAFTAAALPARAQNNARASTGSIVVLGAGLAGLAAATRLKEMGARVIVLEARGIPGGRVRTQRFASGLHGELGAARIADTHSYVLEWVGKFGLTLAQFQDMALAPVFAAGGRRFTISELAKDAATLRLLHPGERGLTPPQLLERYIQQAPATLAAHAPDSDMWQAWRSFDAQTWPEFLRTRGASDEAVRLITLGNEAGNISALYVLRQIMLHRDVRQYLTIAGGLDALPRAFATRLGSSAIVYGARVKRIEHSGASRVIYESKGRENVIVADRILSTLPFSVLRDIPMDGALSAEKRASIQKLPYRAATRILLQTDSPFWRKARENGWARTDAPAEIWDDSFGQSGKGGLLSATLTGRSGIDATDAVTQAFPQLRLHLRAQTVHRWGQDPYARGAFAEFHPGDMTKFSSAIARPEGRMHFAGEHCSPWTGWMEGAFESAERAVQEIAGA